jgi:L-seryl-tRNA(Ser) seleniumtransferase
MTRTETEIHACAERLLPPLQQRFAKQFNVSITPCQSQIGSGSLPIDRLPSIAITLMPHSGKGGELEALSQQCRSLSRPVIGRISEGKLWLDLRCLEDEEGLLHALLQELRP